MGGGPEWEDSTGACARSPVNLDILKKNSCQSNVDMLDTDVGRVEERRFVPKPTFMEALQGQPSPRPLEYQLKENNLLDLDKIVVHLPSDALPYPSISMELESPWRRALIVKVLGRSVSYTMLYNHLCLFWRPPGEHQLLELGHSFFCFDVRMRIPFIGR